MTPHAAEGAGDGWKAYPENKPERDRCYIVQTPDGRICIWTSAYAGDWCGEAVVAFRELPPKYEQPKPKVCRFCGDSGHLENCIAEPVCCDHFTCRERIAAKLARTEAVVEAAKKWRESTITPSIMMADSFRAIADAVDALAASQAKGGGA